MKPPVSERSRLLLALALLASPFAAAATSCAAGTDLQGTTSSTTATETITTTTTTTTTSTTTSSTTTTGTGGAGGAGGTGGTGTTSTTSSSSSTTTSAGGSGGGGGGDAGTDDAGDAGPPITTTVVMLAASGSQILAGTYQPGAGWTTAMLGEGTADRPAVAITTTAAVGLIRSPSTGELRFTTWTSGGSWAPLAPVAAGVTTRATPAISASGAVANAVFHGNDFKHYFAAYNGAWGPTAEPLTPGANQSFGPSPAAVASIGTDVIATFAGNNHDLYDQTRTGGVWQGAHGQGLGDAVQLTPAITTLTGGASDLMVAYVRTSDARIAFTTRTGTTWSAPQMINTNALSNDPVSLAPLPNGGAMLVYRGQNGKTFWSRYTPNSSPAWSSPTGISAMNFDTPSTPSVTAGVTGADAEMVFVDAGTGSAMHTRFNGMAWTVPMQIGGAGLSRAAVASVP